MKISILETLCCTTCNRQVQSALFDQTFLPKLAGLLVIFATLALLIWIIIRVYARHHNRAAQPGYYANPVPLLRASLILGTGLGGFIDGIVFHQLLQWHQMLSNQLAPTTLVAKSVNMFWDGIFHAGMLIVVAFGIALLWKITRRENCDTSGRILAGGFFIGWGMFNTVEGIIDHHVLKLHNVRELAASQDLWNYGFLFVSAVFVILGTVIFRSHAPVPAHKQQ
jgi:uncharacterized membrane protein